MTGSPPGSGVSGGGGLDGAAALLGIALVTVASVLSLFLPARGPLGEGPTEFSADRAARHVEVVAREPHPAGSPAQEAVRSYLLETLRGFGIEPELQPVRAGEAVLENLIVRLPGTNPRSTVLLLAHYDSRPTTPGAGDDASGTAALLETLRALTASPPLANDLVFLFSDGEELGLLGAAGFADEHPLAARVDLVLNFEAIGNAGPAVLFETGAGNGWFVRELARACPNPVASSLGKVVYDALPNDTDYSEFRDRGVPGLNFAICCGSTAYHQPADRPENLARASLASQGATALALARHFGELDCRDRREADAIFFNLPGGPLVHVSVEWAVLAAAVLLLFTLVHTAAGIGRGAYAPREIFRASLVTLGILAAVVLSAAAAWWLLDGLGARLVHLLEQERPRGNAASSVATYLGLVLVVWSGWAVGLGRVSPRTLAIGSGLARVAAAGLGIAVAWGAPGACYAVLLPLVGGHLAAAGRPGVLGTLRRAVGILVALVPCLSVGLLVYMVASRAPAPAALVVTLSAAALGGLLAPALSRAGRSRGPLLLIALLGAALLAGGGVLRGLGA